MLATVAMHRDQDGMWIAECLNMPGCVSEGESEGEALEMLKGAMRAWLAAMRDEYPDLDQRLVDVEVRQVRTLVEGHAYHCSPSINENMRDSTQGRMP
jgi:predicted RNase H-like HicB family nuclease